MKHPLLSLQDGTFKSQSESLLQWFSRSSHTTKEFFSLYSLGLTPWQMLLLFKIFKQGGLKLNSDIFDRLHSRYSNSDFIFKKRLMLLNSCSAGQVLLTMEQPQKIKKWFQQLRSSLQQTQWGPLYLSHSNQAHRNPCLDLTYVYGHAGLASYLGLCIELDIEEVFCHDLLTHLLSFYKKIDDIYHDKPWPKEIPEPPKLRRGFCAGDLGVGFAFMLSGQRSQRSDIFDWGEQIFSRVLQIKDLKKEWPDPYLAYGSMGVAYMCFRAFYWTGISEYWEKSLQLLWQGERQISSYIELENPSLSVLYSSIGYELISNTITKGSNSSWDAILGIGHPASTRSQIHLSQQPPKVFGFVRQQLQPQSIDP